MFSFETQSNNTNQEFARNAFKDSQKRRLCQISTFQHFRKNMICDLTPNKAPCVNKICQKKCNLKMVIGKRRWSMWDWWGKVQGILGCPHQSGLHVTLFRGWWPRLLTRSIPTLLTSSNPNRSFLSRISYLSTTNVLQFQTKEDIIRFCLWAILIIPFNIFLQPCLFWVHFGYVNSQDEC